MPKAHSHEDGLEKHFISRENEVFL